MVSVTGNTVTLNGRLNGKATLIMGDAMNELFKQADQKPGETITFAYCTAHETRTYSFKLEGIS